ncbi:MAG: hypothetical protein KDC35_15380 [Acidobacteria bacterium]|nr:hypothetical protein [Acidobacteriota bacterium]
MNSLPGPMQLNHTLFIIAALFLVLLVILNQWLFKPLVSVLDERQRLIEEGAEAQRSSSKTVEESLARYQERVIEARRTAQSKRNAILKESEMVRGEVVASAKEQALALVQAAATEIEAKVTETREALTAESRQLANRIVDAVLSRAGN